MHAHRKSQNPAIEYIIIWQTGKLLPAGKTSRQKKMKNKINQLLEEVSQLAAANQEELEALRIKYLSKKGQISELFNDFRNVANEEKREVGQLLNELKNVAQDKINELKDAFSNSATEDNKTDLTRCADPVKLGTRHPLSLVKHEIIDIFSRIGFTIAEGPEIEVPWRVHRENGSGSWRCAGGHADERSL